MQPRRAYEMPHGMQRMMEAQTQSMQAPTQQKNKKMIRYKSQLEPKDIRLNYLKGVRINHLKEVSLDQVSIVREYPDVFPDEFQEYDQIDMWSFD